MKNKKLGVVGGMGPMATSVFFERIIQKTKANKDQEHLDMVIINHASMPDRTEAILSGDGENFIRTIGEDLKMLEKLGISNIAIPCNTAHFFFDQMQALTSVNIINMVEETIDEIANKYGINTNVGILATHGTIHTGTYEKACVREGLNFVKPDEATQQVVMDIIYDIKSDVAVDPIKLEDIVMYMVEAHACKCVILACTELSLIPLRKDVSKFCVDAMDVLVEKSIVYSGKILK